MHLRICSQYCLVETVMLSLTCDFAQLQLHEPGCPHCHSSALLLYSCTTLQVSHGLRMLPQTVVMYRMNYGGVSGYLLVACCKSDTTCHND